MRSHVVVSRGMFGPSDEDIIAQQNTQSMHLSDLPNHLRGEATAQLIYEKLKEDATYNNCLQTIYAVVHQIDYYKYMDGIIANDMNVISLAAREVVNACGSCGITVDPDVITNILFRR